MSCRAKRYPLVGKRKFTKKWIFVFPTQMEKITFFDKCKKAQFLARGGYFRSEKKSVFRIVFVQKILWAEILESREYLTKQKKCTYGFCPWIQQNTVHYFFENRYHPWTNQNPKTQISENTPYWSFQRKSCFIFNYHIRAKLTKSEKVIFFVFFNVFVTVG